MRRLVAVATAILVVGSVILGGCASNGTTSVKRSASAPTPTAQVPGDASRGKMVYVSLCYGCHSPEAKVGPSFASEEFRARYQTADVLTKVVRTGRHPMPQFSRDRLDDKGIADLLAYIKAPR